jgi:hypothetical protein
MKTALRQLVIRVEKALYQQETAVCFLTYRKGDFHNTSYDTCAALVRHGVDYTILQWIGANLVGRLATATLNGYSMIFVVSRGFSFCHRSYGALLLTI